MVATGRSAAPLARLVALRVVPFVRAAPARSTDNEKPDSAANCVGLMETRGVTLPSQKLTVRVSPRHAADPALARFIRRLDDAAVQAGPGRLPPWVYFIEALPGGFIKIGWSVQPLRRMSENLAFVPPDVKLRLLAIMPGDGDDELALHRRFAHLRVRGEWFEPGDDLLLYIRACAAIQALEGPHVA